ncbi:MAG: hypothetical protein ACTS3F_03085 [Phycisphaerales bacterium]
MFVPLVLGLGIGIASGLGGCASYINYPPVGDDWAINHTNVNPSHAIMEAGMLRALRRSGAPGGLAYDAYVVNPPRGTELRHAEALVNRLNAVPGFEGAQIVTPDNAHLPAFHITRLWVRGDAAVVDVLRPIMTVRPQPGATEVHQPYTVWLRGGGLEQWRTVATRDWPVGMETPPERWTWRSQFPQSDLGPSDELRPVTAPEPVTRHNPDWELLPPDGGDWATDDPDLNGMEPDEPSDPNAGLEFGVRYTTDPSDPAEPADPSAPPASEPDEPDSASASATKKDDRS